MRVRPGPNSNVAWSRQPKVAVRRSQAKADRPLQQAPFLLRGLLQALGHGAEEEAGEGVLVPPGPDRLAETGVVIQRCAVKIAGGQGGQGREIRLGLRVPLAGEGDAQDILRAGGADVGLQGIRRVPAGDVNLGREIAAAGQGKKLQLDPSGLPLA